MAVAMRNTANYYSPSPTGGTNVWRDTLSIKVYFQLLRLDCFSTPFGATVEETASDATGSIATPEAAETATGCERGHRPGFEPAESLQ